MMMMVLAWKLFDERMRVFESGLENVCMYLGRGGMERETPIQLHSLVGCTWACCLNNPVLFCMAASAYMCRYLCASGTCVHVCACLHMRSTAGEKCML